MSGHFAAWVAGMGAAAANHLWQSTACVAGAWLLTLALRRNQARVRYAVWVAASIKFLVPFSLLMAAGNLLPHPRQAVAPAVYSAMDGLEEPFADAMSFVAPPVVHVPTMRERVEAELPAGLFAVWVMGAAVVMLVWGTRWRAVRRIRRDAKPVDEGREWEILRRVEGGASTRLGKGKYGDSGAALQNDDAQRDVRGIELRMSAERMEPGIFGVWRPVLVWPQELSARLDDGHIEAVVAHELAHVRRRDNLTAALHMMVETVFWFHPAVWWMERRMVKEREQACDEAVVGVARFEEGVVRSSLDVVRSPVGEDSSTPPVPLRGTDGAPEHSSSPLIAQERAMNGPPATSQNRDVGHPATYAEVYAEALLKTCRFCVESPLKCVAGVTGADLKQRVVEIVTGRALVRMSWAKKALVAMAAVCVVAAPVMLGIVRMIPLYGQILHAEGPLPSFEVATIRPLEHMLPPPPPGGGPPRMAPNGEPIVAQQEIRISSAPPFSDRVNRLTTAKNLIADAYRLPAFSKAQIVGGPDWTEQTFYQISAKIGDSQYVEMQKMPSEKRAERVRLMEQSLLADRFKLKAHFETRELPVYALEVAKGGPKLTLTKAESTPGSPRDQVATISATSKGDEVEIKGKGASPGQLILFFQQQPELGNRIVIDKTGLTAKYDMVLDWRRAGPAMADAGSATADAGPSFFTALKEQLGLELVETKGPAEVIVIDHIEQPTLDGAEVAQPAPTTGSLATVQPLQQVAALGSLRTVQPLQAATIQGKSTQRQVAQSLTSACPDVGLFAAYDVVSVRPTNTIPRMVGLQEQPDGIRSETVPVAMMVQQAYSTERLATNDAVIGLPDWGKGEYFAVNAKMNPAQVAAFAKLDKDQQKGCRIQMLRALLADRFKVQVHSQTRQVLGYDMVVASGGPKMKEVAAGDPDVFVGSSGRPMLKNSMRFAPSAGGGQEAVVQNFPLDQLAAALQGSSSVGHKVVNKTGLTGMYRYTLTYALEGGAGPAGEASDPAPTVFNALEEQLGLKLVRETETVEVVVVDHVERPAAN